MSIEYAFADETADIAAMKELWQEAFGDEAAVIDAFFATLYAPENTVIATENGKILGCAYLMPSIPLQRLKEQKRACYFYALAVRRDSRGQGIGRSILRFCGSAAAERGEVLCLMPGDDELREWYRACGMRDWCGLQREMFMAGEEVSLGLEPIGLEDYLAEREKLLADKPHALLPENYFRYQAAMCALSEGGFLRLRDDKGNSGVACVMTAGARVHACELLFDGNVKLAARAIAAFFCAECCSVLLLGNAPGLMAAGAESAPELWWGPVLD